MGYEVHVSLDVKGALRWPKKQLKGLFRNEQGKKCTGKEVYDHLLDLLADGHEQIQTGACPNFDKKLGCQCYLQEANNK